MSCGSWRTGEQDSCAKLRPTPVSQTGEVRHEGEEIPTTIRRQGSWSKRQDTGFLPHEMRVRLPPTPLGPTGSVAKRYSSGFLPRRLKVRLLPDPPPWGLIQPAGCRSLKPVIRVRLPGPQLEIAEWFARCRPHRHRSLTCEDLSRRHWQPSVVARLAASVMRGSSTDEHPAVNRGG